MASGSCLRFSVTVRCCFEPQNQRFFVGHSSPTTLILPHLSFSRSSSVLVFSRRENELNSVVGKSKKKNRKQSSSSIGGNEDDNLDVDAFEALFRQLEEDLKNDDPSLTDLDDEISEEDLAKLERELEEALGDDELLGAFDSSTNEKAQNEAEDDVYEEEEEEDVDDDEEEEELRPVKLKNWQLKRLAYALKNGRRKTSIKNLAAELCLDRAIVLELLRDPPPDLLMLSAALPDKPVSPILEPETKPMETIPLVTETDASKPNSEMKLPVHVMQRNWIAQKRLKKAQVGTLEAIYQRTKRPTNAIISSIVHVTNLPRKRVIKWFEDKRAEDGVPNRRLPFRRATPDSVFTS